MRRHALRHALIIIHYADSPPFDSAASRFTPRAAMPRAAHYAHDAT